MPKTQGKTGFKFRGPSASRTPCILLLHDLVKSVDSWFYLRDGLVASTSTLAVLSLSTSSTPSGWCWKRKLALRCRKGSGFQTWISGPLHRSFELGELFSIFCKHSSVGFADEEEDSAFVAVAVVVAVVVEVVVAAVAVVPPELAIVKRINKFSILWCGVLYAVQSAFSMD